VDDVALRLLESVESALPGWVLACVERRLDDAFGTVDPLARTEAQEAGRAAAGELVPRLRALLEADIDAQSTTPLALVRQAVAWPARILATRGVPPVERDAFTVERFPDDVYDLTPATMADLSEEAGEAAIAWGAAKAWEHRRRHGRPSPGG